MTMARERAEHENNAPASPRYPLPIAEVRQLISLMSASDLEEITIEQETTGLRLVLRKPPAPPAPAAELELASLAELDGSAGGDPASDAATAPTEPLAEVRAPLVGIFRASLKRAASPAVQSGDVVKEGQVVGAIEALNVLNEIESPAEGRVKDILVADGQAVEYGQLLLLITPSAP